MATPDPAADAAPPPAGWRFKLGIALFAIAFLIWLAIPLAAALGVSASRIAGLTGTIFVANKLMLLAVIGILGKSGFRQLKGMVFGRVAKLAPDAMVGPVRYNIGLVMFCLPILTAWIEPYLDTLWPDLRPNLWQAQLLGDLMFVGSFFVLGGNFWGKIRALFVRTAVVVDTAGDTAA
jgi:hypothetical protein